jgi:DNA-binding Xre family transcriptional regulator
LKLVNDKIDISMANSLSASKSGLEIIDQARKRKGWNKDAQTWIDRANQLLQSSPNGSVSRSTLQRFWRREAIRQENFKAFCQSVGVDDWEVIVDNVPTQKSASYMDFIIYDDAWVGRENLIQDLSQRLNNSCRVLLLVGITGIGKTALAERVVEELRGDWREQRDNFEDERKPQILLVWHCNGWKSVEKLSQMRSGNQSNCYGG